MTSFEGVYLYSLNLKKKSKQPKFIFTWSNSSAVALSEWWKMMCVASRSQAFATSGTNYYFDTSARRWQCPHHKCSAFTWVEHCRLFSYQFSFLIGGRLSDPPISVSLPISVVIESFISQIQLLFRREIGDLPASTYWEKRLSDILRRLGNRRWLTGEASANPLLLGFQKETLVKFRVKIRFLILRIIEKAV